MPPVLNRRLFLLLKIEYTAESRVHIERIELMLEMFSLKGKVANASLTVRRIA
jgi:hypothetical protein